ncbi:MAG: GH25 family lysozyme [Candidatus Dadabacteria bacterium]|nr:GH25 family lysozyme [Candidatus Dadabacteria bacterium]
MNRLIAILAALILVLIVAVIFFDKGYIRFNYPDKSEYPVHGIDISHHQDVIDWDVLKRSDISFAFIKATEGGDHKDTKFKENWKRAGDIGLVRGAYHFFTFCKTGREQALNYIDSVPFENNTLPPAIDLEFSGNCKARPSKEEVLKELSVFAKLVKLKYGKDPIIYTTNESYNAFISGENLVYPVWIRDVYTKPGLKDNSPWTFWQYTHKGRLHGIDGFVDLNVFNGTSGEFQNFLASGK